MPGGIGNAPFYQSHDGECTKAQGTESFFIDCSGKRAYHFSKRNFLRKEAGDGVVSWTVTSCGKRDRGKALWIVKDPKGFFSFFS